MTRPLTAAEQQVEREWLLEHGRSAEEVERGHWAMSARPSVFVVFAGESIWGVFVDLAAAKDCAARCLRATMYPDGRLTWEEVEMLVEAGDPPDPRMAIWRAFDEEHPGDGDWRVEQWAIGQQPFTTDLSPPETPIAASTHRPESETDEPTCSRCGGPDTPMLCGCDG